MGRRCGFAVQKLQTNKNTRNKAKALLAVHSAVGFFVDLHSIRRPIRHIWMADHLEDIRENTLVWIALAAKLDASLVDFNLGCAGDHLPWDEVLFLLW